MDIFEHARTHHRRAVRLVGQLRAARSDDERNAARDALQQELHDHEVVEAQLLYPALRKTEGMQPQVGSLLGEHAHLKALGARIFSADPHRPEWEQAIDDLAASLTQHVNAEESRVFPRARNTLDVREIERLSRQADDPGRAGRRPGGADAGSDADSDAGSRFAAGTAQAVHEAGGQVGEEAGRWAAETRERARSIAREQGQAVAGRGHVLADALRETGEGLERRGEGAMGHALADAADGVERWMRRLESGDIGRIADELGAAARRHPLTVFALAGATGFLAARFLRSSRGDAHGAPARSSEDVGFRGPVHPGL